MCYTFCISCITLSCFTLNLCKLIITKKPHYKQLDDLDNSDNIGNCNDLDNSDNLEYWGHFVEIDS
jgi:hypothetical protein